MCIGFSRTIAIVLIGILICHVQGLRKTLDFESSGVCESRQTVSDNDLYFLVANPRNDLPSGRDHCNIYFTADPPIRKFYLYIRKLQISDCGVSLKVYDGDPYLKNHRWALSCKRPPAWKLETWYGSIALRLEKYTAESSNNYAIDIILTTDQGPPVDTETPGGMEGISTGAIIGIAVGAGLGVTVIVGFVVFCACRMYSSDKDDKRPPSTVFSTAASGTGPQVNGILKRPEKDGDDSFPDRRGSYREKKSYDNPAYRSSVSDDLESGSNFSGMPSGRDSYDEIDENFERRNRHTGGEVVRDSYWDERRENIDRSLKRRDGERGSMRESRRDSMRKANRYRNRETGDYIEGRNPAYRSDRDRGHSNPAYRDDSPEKPVKAVSLSTIGSLNSVRDRNRSRHKESESESSSVTPSRATDDSRGSSSATDGTSEHKYRRRDDDLSLRRSRSRSSSRSSARGRRERSERSQHQQHLNYQSGQQPRRHSHRGSRRKKQKEPSPYLDVFKEAKKKKKPK